MNTGLARDRLQRGISWWILFLGAAVGLGSFAYYFLHGLTTAHYDAKAHLVVARHIVDSITPGYAQMGMNWLPLTHLAYLPFVLFDAQYRSGFIPSLLSVVAFAFSGWLVFRITCRVSGSTPAGVFAGILLIANPNLQYLQSCPLTEPLFMMLFLLSIDGLLVWRGSGAAGLPWGPALWAALSALCRYEGWYFLAGVILLFAVDFRTRTIPRKKTVQAAVLYVILFTVPVGAHFGYIYACVGDSFLHRVAEGNPAPFETHGRPLLSIAYHLAALSQIASLLPLLAGFAGLAWVCISRKRLQVFFPLLLLWIPSAINISALYWGMIYRIRYSVLLLPAIAVFGGLAASDSRLCKRVIVAASSLAALLVWISWYMPREWQYHALLAGPGNLLLPSVALILFLYAQASGKHLWPLLLLCVFWMHKPAIEGENRPILAETLEHGFIEPERQAVIQEFRKNYDGTRILMDMLKLAPLAFDSGLPLKEYITNEGDKAPWRRTISSPDAMAGWVCAQQGDDVWNLLQVDRHWLDKYSLAVHTEHFLVYRLRGTSRGNILRDGRNQ